MIKVLTTALALVALACRDLPSCAQVNRENQLVKATGNLPVVLLELTKRFNASVIAELREPVPQDLRLSQRTDLKLTEALSEIGRQVPGYLCMLREGVVIFADKKSYMTKQDPLATPIERYYIPGDLSTFRRTFPNAVRAAEEGIKNPGVLGSGLAEPDQEAVQLSPREVRKTNGLEILLLLAQQTRTFYSVFILPLPGERPSLAFRHWDLTGGSALPQHTSKLSNFTIAPETARQLEKIKSNSEPSDKP